MHERISPRCVYQHGARYFQNIPFAWLSDRMPGDIATRESTPMTDRQKAGVIGFYDTHPINEDEILAKLAARGDRKSVV